MLFIVCRITLLYTQNKKELLLLLLFMFCEVFIFIFLTIEKMNKHKFVIRTSYIWILCGLYLFVWWSQYFYILYGKFRNIPYIKYDHALKIVFVVMRYVYKKTFLWNAYDIVFGSTKTQNEWIFIYIFFGSSMQQLVMYIYIYRLHYYYYMCIILIYKFKKHTFWILYEGVTHVVVFLPYIYIHIYIQIVVSLLFSFCKRG